MRYLKVHWIHQNPDYPVVLYSELDDNRWEVRKVEIFLDGHCGYADATESTGSTELGKVPIPPLSEILPDPQFSPKEIAQEEFERIWEMRKSSLGKLP